MKRLTLTLIALTTSLITLPAGAQAVPVEVNRIVAKVNGRVITENAVNMLMEGNIRQLQATYPRRGDEYFSKVEEARKRVIDELIERQIILDEFKKIGAKIDEHHVDDDIKRQINTLHNGDKAAFNAWLRKNRLTMERFREMNREKMIVQAMRAQQFSDTAPPLPSEIREEYNKVKRQLRDVSKDVVTFQKIYIPIEDPNAPNARDTTLQVAELIVQDLKAGKDFAELAKTHSKDAFANDGGLQENVARTDLYAEVASIIFDSKEGDIIGPLDETVLGAAGRGIKPSFTIIKPIKITIGPEPSLDEIRDIVEERVRINKSSERFKQWMETRRKRAMIQIMK